MKVLLLTHNTAGVGGGYMRAFSLGTHLAADGHEVTVIAGRSTPGLFVRKTRLGGVVLVEMPDILPHRIRNGGLSIIDLLFRSFWILTHRYHIIHGIDHRPAVLIPALIGQKLKGMTFVSDWADLWGEEGIAAQRVRSVGKLLGRVDQYLENQIRLWADGATAITSDLDRRLEIRGVPQRRRMLLPPASDLSLISPVNKTLARERCGLPLAVPIAGFTGFAPYDREFLIQVVFEILDTDANAILISSGAVIPELTEHSATPEFRGRILQFGTVPVTEMKYILGAADVLILPYLNQSINRGRFPNKFGDYLAAQRPIITHDTADLGKLVRENNLGRLSSEDPIEYAAEVVRMINSPEECESVSANGRWYAENHWNWAIRARDVTAFYRSLK